MFAQNLLGFTAMQTGLILLPGSLATAVMMPVVGKMLQKGVPAQLMNAAGLHLLLPLHLSAQPLDARLRARRLLLAADPARRRSRRSCSCR